MEVCELHAALMATINRWDERMETMSRDMTHVKKAVDNGLRAELKEAVSESLAEFDRKYAGVVEFKWFRELMTDFRNNLFRNFLKLAFGGVVLIFLIHLGDNLVKVLIKGVAG